MFGNSCPPKNIWREKQETSLPKTSLKQSSYPKFPEEEVSTKKSLKRHSLPKNVWREIPTKHICQKSLQKKYIWRDRRNILYHSFEEHLYQKKWREIPSQKIDDKWLPKNKRHLFAKKFQETFQQKRISQEAIFWQNNFMKNIDQQIFEE